MWNAILTFKCVSSLKLMSVAELKKKWDGKSCLNVLSSEEKLCVGVVLWDELEVIFLKRHLGAKNDPHILFIFSIYLLKSHCWGFNILLFYWQFFVSHLFMNESGACIHQVFY